MGLYYVLKNSPKGSDPLSSKNVLSLFTGVLTGVPISGQSRLSSVARSPLTYAVGDAQSGGFFPAELKFSGYDGIVLKGKSKTPVYIWINDGKIEIKDASHLWGKITSESEKLIKEELNDKRIEVLQICFKRIMDFCFESSSKPLKGSSIASKLNFEFLVFFISKMVLKIFNLWAWPPLIEEAFSIKFSNNLSEFLNPNSWYKPIDFKSFRI